MNSILSAKKILLLVAAFLSGTYLVAAESVTTVSPEKKLKVLSSLELSQKVSVDERSERESSTDFMLAPSYKLSENLTLSARAILSKSNNGPRDTTLANSTLSLGIRGIAVTPQITSLHSVSVVVPTNKEAQKNDRLITSANVSNGLRLQTRFARLDYRLGLTKNIHEFTINAVGSPNIEYRLAHAVDLTVPLIDRLSLSSAAVYRQGWTYRNFERYGFEWHNDINWDFTETLSMNVGISNDGSALKANGVDSNITAFNPNSSATRAGLSYTY